MTMGVATPLWLAAMYGGMAGGALTGGLQGGWKGMLMGAAIGGAMGGLGGWGAGIAAAHGMGGLFLAGTLIAGAGAAAATDSLDSFAGGLTGAVLGTGFVNTQQFRNYKAGNGFRSNAAVRAENRQVDNLRGMLDEKQALSLGRAPTKLEESQLRQAFPKLGEFRITGEPTKNYNCIAWTLGETDTWVNPTSSISGMDKLYGNYGYSAVPKDQAQVALFVKGGVPQHGAVRVSGDWYESKLGQWYQIVHRLEDLEGEAYGNVEKFYGK